MGEDNISMMIFWVIISVIYIKFCKHITAVSIFFKQQLLNCQEILCDVMAVFIHHYEI